MQTIKEIIKHFINRLASYIYFKTMDIYTLGKSIPISKTWSRKGSCPVCKVGTGSHHAKGCLYRKKV